MIAIRSGALSALGAAVLAGSLFGLASRLEGASDAVVIDASNSPSTLNGRVSNQGSLTVNGGTLTIASGVVTNETSGLLRVTGPTPNSGDVTNKGTLINKGTVGLDAGAVMSNTWVENYADANGTILQRIAARIVNELDALMGIDGGNFVNMGEVTNAGTLRMATGYFANDVSDGYAQDGTSYQQVGSLTNTATGIVQIEGGGVSNSGAVANAGRYAMTGGVTWNRGTFGNTGQISVSDGLYSNETTSTLNAEGADTVRVGNLTNAATGTITLNSSGSTFGSLWSSGNLVNDGTIAVAGGSLGNHGTTLNWSDGTSMRAFGSFTNNGTVAMTSGELWNSGTFTNAGQVTVSGGTLSNETGYTTHGDGTRTVDAGTMTNAATGTITLNSSGSAFSLLNYGNLINDGTIAVAGGSLGNHTTTWNWSDGTSTRAVGNFTNNGSMAMTGGGAWNSGIFTNAGQVTVSGDTLINSTSYTTDADGTHTGFAGTMTNAATGRITLSSSASSSGSVLNYGNLVNDGTIAVAGGSLGNHTTTSYWTDGTSTSAVGSFTNSGTVVITAGSIENSGRFANTGRIGIAGGALLANWSAGEISMSAGRIDNAGRVLSDGSVDITGGLVNNAGGGQMDIAGGSFRSTGTFENEGNIHLSSAARATISTFSQTAGSTRVDGIWDGGSLSISGGALGGSGSIASNVTIGTGAHLLAGTDGGVGILTFSGNLTLASGAILNFDLGGTSDLLVFTTGILAGPSGVGGLTLNIRGLSGFGAGNYDLVRGATFVDFDASDFNFGAMPAGFDYRVSVSDSTLTLNVTGSAVPEPSTYAVVVGLAALIAAVARRGRRSAGVMRGNG